MRHANISNIPSNPKEIFDYAITKSFKTWVDEKGTEKHPRHTTRELSDLTYEEAYEIIQNNKPHWVISFRNNSYFGDEDFWEFGGCNIANNSYGDVFIWIQVEESVGLEIINKFNLKINKY
jgi:hypothetical protein